MEDVTELVLKAQKGDEIAMENMKECDGNSTYRNRIIDAVYNMNGEILDKGAKYEIR